MEVKTFSPPERILLGPGPSNVHPRVLQAMAQPTIGHLDPAFIGLMEEIKFLLRYTFKTENEITFPVSGPGSVGMETCLVNLVEPGMKVAVCVNGVFGGRIRDIVERCGAQPIVIDAEWGRAINPQRLDDVLISNPDIKLTAFIHAETSTGAQSNIKELTEISHRHSCLVIADTVTSLGGIPVMVDEWNLDAVYSGSQKCLSCPPGLSPVTFNERALHAIKNRKTKVQSWFMDINLITSYWGSGSRRSYHHTAPINALYGLYEALLLLKEEGLENSWERHKKNSEKLIDGLKNLGLSTFVKEEERLPELITIKIPDGVDDLKVRNYLLDKHNIEIGAGLGSLAGKIWRIGLMGYSSNEENISRYLNGMKEAFKIM